jgi:hypothetical protein
LFSLIFFLVFLLTPLLHSKEKEELREKKKKRGFLLGEREESG